MATNAFQNITARGTQAAFSNAMDALPNIWEKYVTRVPSDAPDEKHVWMGMLPQPREFLGANEWDGILDFSFDVANKTYKMNFIIDEESMEDDRHSLINRRIQEAAEAWGTFKDSQFKDLLVDNTTDTFDGTAFFADTRVIGVSANIDNNLAVSGLTDEENPTAGEFLTALKTGMQELWVYQDDQARTGYNAGAMSTVRFLVPPKYERAAVEAVNSTIIANTSNPWGQNLGEVDVLAYLDNTNDVFYIAATGAARMPILYQERTNMSITIVNNAEDVAVNNGVLVLVRQRYRMTYGEPRRMQKITLS